MKILVVSDLHLEFSDVTIPNPGADVLVLAGDIMLASALRDYPEGCEVSTSKYYWQAQTFRAFLKRCSKAFKHVVYCAGNHEFYRGRFFADLETLRIETAQFSNVYFMEDDQRVIEGVRFVGCTLWTDCNNEDALTMWSLPRRMNDYYIIKNDKNSWRSIRPEDTLARHKQSLAYIRTAVNESQEPVVVVGHHAPTTESIHEKYRSDHEMNGGFASDLTEFILEHTKIKVWCHGHTHNCFDYMVGETRVVCNPRGYSEGYYREETGWNPEKLIEVETAVDSDQELK